MCIKQIISGVFYFFITAMAFVTIKNIYIVIFIVELICFTLFKALTTVSNYKL